MGHEESGTQHLTQRNEEGSQLTFSFPYPSLSQFCNAMIFFSIRCHKPHCATRDPYSFVSHRRSNSFLVIRILLSTTYALLQLLKLVGHRQILWPTRILQSLHHFFRRGSHSAFATPHQGSYPRTCRPLNCTPLHHRIYYTPSAILLYLIPCFNFLSWYATLGLVGSHRFFKLFPMFFWSGPPSAFATPDQGSYLAHIDNSLQMMSSHELVLPPMLAIVFHVLVCLDPLENIADCKYLRQWYNFLPTAALTTVLKSFFLF